MREEELIHLVRRHKAVYNNKSADYRDPKKRREAWVEIANQYGSTIDECKEAWSKLRNCFTNAIKRRTKKKRFLEPWRFEEQMAFLRPFLKEYHERDGNTYIKDDPEAVTFYEDSWDSNTTAKRGQSPESIRDPSPSPTAVSYKRKASTDVSLFGMMDADDNSHHIKQNSQDLDDIDHFFLSMSKMAKRLPRIDQLRITLDLHKAISEAELRQLQQDEDQPESTTSNRKLSRS